LIVLEVAPSKPDRRKLCEVLMKSSFLIMLTALVVLCLLLPVQAQDATDRQPWPDWTPRPSATTSCELSAATAPQAERLAPDDLLSEIAHDSSSAEPGAPPSPISSSPRAVVQTSEAPKAEVQWKSLMKGSLSYLGVMHSFRIATEAGTREGLHNSVFGGYFKALGAMHGWSDGDGYYENYLGHPIEGAVSGYIWVQNDPRYRAVQFGTDRDYWMSRLRAYAFAWAFSEQFEVGPISEASIGQIQRYCCQYGFVDHVITPNGGLVWMLAGDALDRYVTVPIENRTHNAAIRILARGVLNPPQTFANLMMFHYPWRRENRASVTKYDGEMYLRLSRSLAEAISPESHPEGLIVVPKFELAAAVPSFYQVGGLTCLGGGGIGAFRAAGLRQWTVEVGGCTLGNSLPRNWSGDSLTFMAGPQWIVHTAGRWSPHAHFRVGVQKITEKYVDPKLQKQVLSQLPRAANPSDYEDLYSKRWESTGFSMAFGGGLDVALNRALALRVANLDYTRSWLGSLNGRNFDHGLRFSTGLVLRVGTW
jgi:hypothetical protein